MNKTVSIMIVGVGGQGTLLASKILGNVLIEKGYDVKVSEVHGMSQRGGSVVTYVKFGDTVYSPVVDKGEADFIIAFEELEGYRYLPYLKRGGKLMVNAQEINPMPVIVGAAQYPINILDKLNDLADHVMVVDALKIAQESGNVKAVNVVMIGALAKHLGIEKDCFIKAIHALVPEKFLSVNLKAFEQGYATV